MQWRDNRVDPCTLLAPGRKFRWTSASSRVPDDRRAFTRSRSHGCTTPEPAKGFRNDTVVTLWLEVLSTLGTNQRTTAFSSKVKKVWFSFVGVLLTPSRTAVTQVPAHRKLVRSSPAFRSLKLKSQRFHRVRRASKEV